MHLLTSTLADCPDLFGPEPSVHTHSWVLPEPWSTQLAVAIGLVLILTRRPLARLFAATLTWIGLEPTARYHRLASAFFALIGALWVIGGLLGAAVFSVSVTSA
jgi:hypothetical protein